MTVTSTTDHNLQAPPPRTADSTRATRFGGVAALVAAATFVFGIALFATYMVDYTSGDFTPAESAAFVSGHQAPLFAWYSSIYIVFGLALVPLVLTLRDRLRPTAPRLAEGAAVFGYIWAGLMFAAGMISNIGIEVVSDLVDTDPTQAGAVWSSIDAVADGLGGGNELVGALWVGLVCLAARPGRMLGRGLTTLGLISAAAGLATMVPGFEAAEMVFGLGLIVWFTWLGLALVRAEPRQVVRA